MFIFIFHFGSCRIHRSLHRRHHQRPLGRINHRTSFIWMKKHSNHSWRRKSMSSSCSMHHVCVFFFHFHLILKFVAKEKMRCWVVYITLVFCRVWSLQKGKARVCDRCWNVQRWSTRWSGRRRLYTPFGTLFVVFGSRLSDNQVFQLLENIERL